MMIDKNPSDRKIIINRQYLSHEKCIYTKNVILRGFMNKIIDVIINMLDFAPKIYEFCTKNY